MMTPQELKDNHSEYEELVDEGKVTDIVDYMSEKGFDIEEKRQFAMFSIQSILMD